MTAAWLLTVGGVSIEQHCSRKVSINDETGAEIGDDNVDATIVAKTVVGVQTTGATLGRKTLESMESFNNNQ